jgi:integrase
MLLLMTRLGLRRGDVAALELDDIDWARGEVTVCGKGRREDRLPLPTDVGQALAVHLLRLRPGGACRKVFQRACAPAGGLRPSAITAVANSRFARVGIRPGGTHRLRYTAATEMLRHGGSLDEIAQVLRHRSHDTTAIYAKVDRIRLRELAQPWPGGGR